MAAQAVALEGQSSIHALLIFFYQQNNLMCVNNSKCMAHIVNILSEITVENLV